MKTFLARAPSLSVLGLAAGLRSRSRVALLLLAACAAAPGCGGGGGGGGGGSSTNSALGVTGVAPSTGLVGGGLTVTLTGFGFSAGTTTVTFRGVPATGVVVLSDSSLRCITPAGAAGAATISVTNGNGTASFASAFTYLAAPIAKLADTDLDADGIPDLVVGAFHQDDPASNSGAVYVFFGRPGVNWSDSGAGAADVKIRGFGTNTEFGSSLAANDVNGDGKADLVIGAPKLDTFGVDNGAVYVFFGPLSAGLLSAAAADVVIHAESAVSGDWFGGALAASDVNGDQVADIVVGAIHHDTPHANNGAIYVFFGGLGLTGGSAASADIKLTGAEAQDRLGEDIALGDVNGDGIADIVAGSAFHAILAGEVYVFLGGAGLASRGADSADATFSGSFGSDIFGQRLSVGDVNGDGIGDVVVGAPGADLNGTNSGAAYVFFGGAGLADRAASQADVIIDGDHPVDKLGDDVSTGDINGDGIDDLLLGAREADAGATNNGRVYVFFGRPNLVDTGAGAADAIFTGQPVTNENFGQSIDVVDLDGDGMLEICIGAVVNGSGDLHVFFGPTGALDRSAISDDLTISGEASSDGFGIRTARGR